MLDRALIKAVSGGLQWIATGLIHKGVKADMVSWTGFLIGMASVPLIITQNYHWALVCIGLNRLADGLDGTIARLTKPTDRGAFLDISLDFLFYSAIPLGFAIAAPEKNALAATVLIYSFVGTGCTFLAFAVMAAKRGLTSTRYPHKGFYYLGGLTEATETILVFVLMCLFPDWFPILAYGFTGLCAITIFTRIVAGYYNFSDKE